MQCWHSLVRCHEPLYFPTVSGIQRCRHLHHRLNPLWAKPPPSNSTSRAVLSSQCLPPAAPHYKRHLRPPPRTQGRQREQFARSEPWERFREHGGARRRRAGEQGCARGGGALSGGENWGRGPLPLDHHWRWGGWRLPGSTCVLLPQVGNPLGGATYLPPLR